jgi:hypothetical protein
MNGSVNNPENRFNRIEGGLLRAGRGFAGKLTSTRRLSAPNASGNAAG